MSISNAFLPRFARGVPYGFRDRQRVELVPKNICCIKMCKQSCQRSDQSCFCMNTRTTHTRQNKPYRLGAVRAGAVGARGRCCSAATMRVAVVLHCGVCCCIAQNINNEIINRKTEVCHHRPQTKAHSNEYENNTHKAGQALPAWRGAGRSSRGRAPFQNFRFFYLIFVWGLLPKIWGPLPDFGRALPPFGDKTFPKYVWCRVERRYLLLF